MKSVHHQLALCTRYHTLTVCQVGLTTCKTACVGKMTRRGHSPSVRNTGLDKDWKECKSPTQDVHGKREVDGTTLK